MENRKSDRGDVGSGAFLFCLSLFLCTALSGDEKTAQSVQSDSTTAPPEQGEFAIPLKETPIWEVPQPVREWFLYGHYVTPATAKFPNVKYPALNSYTPLCGDARFPSMVRATGTPGHFYFALDRSEIGGAYDLLYIDDNTDADLTNDPVRRPLAQASEGLVRRSAQFRTETYFEPVKVPFDFGPAGSHRLELLPRAQVLEKNAKSGFAFVPLHVRTGAFEIGGRSYRVFRGYPNVIGGRLDKPTASLVLLPPGGGAPAEWLGGRYLNATHRLGTRYCRFSSTPLGDKLFVHPHDGSLGVFEIAVGDRDVKRLEVKGSLATRETSVAVGYTLEGGPVKNQQRYEIPTGDYHPALMEVTVGSIRFTMSSNYPTDAQGRFVPDGEPLCRIPIRRDKPYTLTFSDRPQLVFRQPQQNLRVSVGHEVQIQTTLTDPVPGILIPALYEVVSGETMTYHTPDGRDHTTELLRPLEPTVVIKRAGGEIVAQSGMAFG